MERLNKPATVQKSLEVTDELIEEIKKYSLTEDIDKEKLFVFRVVLCHNDIDRDYEAFSLDSLNTLAELFVGKTGIEDHSMRSSTQIARVIKTEVVTDDSRLTKYGEPYARLEGLAYMVKTPSNEDLITEIQMGIRKEVSVACAIANPVCSICGKNMRFNRCEHKQGAEYDGQICYTKLENPTDAYEWSFVAVPAQVGAGTTKNADINFRQPYPEACEVDSKEKSIKSTLIRALSLKEE